jgi:TRAP-type uncharacterized transport system substrate-binding protein
LKIPRFSWWYLVQTAVPILLVGAALIWGGLHFVHSAPPHTITISAGPPGSTFETVAKRYSTALARNGIQLKVIPSEGSWTI